MEEPEIKNTGALFSPDDERTYQGTGAPQVIHPPGYLPDYSIFPVYNQLIGIGAQTSCGPAGFARAVNILFGITDELSFRFVACLAVKLSGIPLSQGTNLLTVLKVGQKYGIPLAKYFPNDTSLSIEEFSDVSKIPQAAYIDALSRRIGPYGRLADLSEQGLQQAAYVNKIVLVLKAPWQPSSWSDKPTFTNHFNDIDGYVNDVLVKERFANCFGKDWGTQANGGGNGEGFYLASDLATIKEAWVIWPTPNHHFQFTRDLTIGSTGEDVRQLQIFLNSHNCPLTSSGPGSAGQETNYFGNMTQAAVAKYQKNVGITPSVGYFGPLTRASINSTP